MAWTLGARSASLPPLLEGESGLTPFPRCIPFQGCIPFPRLADPSWLLRASHSLSLSIPAPRLSNFTCFKTQDEVKQNRFSWVAPQKPGDVEHMLSFHPPYLRSCWSLSVLTSAHLGEDLMWVKGNGPSCLSQWADSGMSAHLGCCNLLTEFWKYHKVILVSMSMLKHHFCGRARPGTPILPSCLLSHEPHLCLQILFNLF